MISIAELQKIAKERLKDSETLFKSKRFEGANYLCGYVIEIALKARICKTLNWKEGFPSSGKEFNDYKSFKTHNLDVLLRLSGVEEKIKTEFLSEWSSLADWNPESRYEPIGTAKSQDVEIMINSAKKFLEIL